MLASTADAPSTTTPSVAIFSPGRTMNRSPTTSRSTGMRTSRPSRRTDGVLGRQLQQRPQRRAGAAAGPGLGVPAGEHERGDAGGDLEVDVRRRRWPWASVRRNGCVSPGVPALPEEQRVQRPAERGHRPDRHQRVHRRGAVAQVGPRRTVQRQRAPHDHRRGQGQRRPLPVRELQRRHHRHGDDGHRQHRAHEQPGALRGEHRVRCRLVVGRLVRPRLGRRPRTPPCSPPAPRRRRGRSTVTVPARVTDAFSVA